MRMTLATTLVMQAIGAGHRHGFDIVEVTGYATGTVYPALRRLESLGYVASSWEDDEKAKKANRPRRRNYQLTSEGREHLAEAEARYRAVSKLFPKRGRA